MSVVQSYDEHTGQTEISLVKDNDASFCGLLLSFESEKELQVVSCQRGEAAGKATLSYDEGSPFFVMLDCSENISEKGVLARFLFDGLFDSGIITSVISAYAINEDDLITVAVKLTDQIDAPPLERISDFSLCIEKNADESKLSFSGTVSSTGFAASIDVWVLDVSALEFDRLCFSGVTDRLGRFTIGNLSLMHGRCYCIVIEFAEYNRLSIDVNEAKVFVLYDGILY